MYVYKQEGPIIISVSTYLSCDTRRKKIKLFFVLSEDKAIKSFLANDSTQRLLSQWHFRISLFYQFVEWIEQASWSECVEELLLKYIFGVNYENAKELFIGWEESWRDKLSERYWCCWSWVDWIEVFARIFF